LCTRPKDAARLGVCVAMGRRPRALQSVLYRPDSLATPLCAVPPAELAAVSGKIRKASRGRNMREAVERIVRFPRGKLGNRNDILERLLRAKNPDKRQPH
jgi:hypothetical protein